MSITLRYNCNEFPILGLVNLNICFFRIFLTSLLLLLFSGGCATKEYDNNSISLNQIKDFTSARGLIDSVRNIENGLPKIPFCSRVVGKLNAEGKSDDALQVLQYVQELATHQDTLNRLFNLVDLGYTYLYQAKNDSAKIVKDKVQIASNTSNAWKVHKGIFLGNYYFVSGDLQNAEVNFLSAHNACKQNLDTPNIITTANNLGAIYFNQNDFLKARMMFSEAYRHDLNSKYTLPMLIFNLAKTNILTQEVNQAITLLDNYAEEYGKQSTFSEEDEQYYHIIKSLAYSTGGNQTLAYQELNGPML